MSATLTIKGIDTPLAVSMRFTTVVRHIEKAKADGIRVTLPTGSGRIAVEPATVSLIQEVKDAKEEADKAEPVGAAAEGPFG